MSSRIVSLHGLRDCLSSAAPVELDGMRLLKERPQFLLEALPTVPRERLVAAVTEIIDYTGRCMAAAQKLATVPPVPLTAATVPEFGL
jgi:hypothetical protein